MEAFSVQFDPENPADMLVKDLLKTVNERLGAEPTTGDYIEVMTSLGHLVSLVWLRTDIAGRALVPFLLGIAEQTAMGHDAMVKSHMMSQPGTADVGTMEPEGNG